MTKYRYAVLGGDVGQRCRELVRETARAREIIIHAGSINRDHVHLLLSIPPSLSVSRAVQYLKGRSSLSPPNGGPKPALSRNLKPPPLGGGAFTNFRWITLTNGVVGEGRALYRALVDADLEGIVAKHLADAYHPKLVWWQKVLNRGHSQCRGRAEWFRERR